MEESPVPNQQGARAGATGSPSHQSAQRAQDDSKEELSPLSSPGQHYSDDAWKSETTETDGQDQSGGHGDSMTSTHSVALHSAISEVSKEYLTGLTRTGQNLSENDSSDISSDGDHKPQDRSGLYPETAAGLSDNDWNPYGTGPESDTNCTPRVSGRERPSRVSADGDSGASKESTLPSYTNFDPLKTSSKVNDMGASAPDIVGLSVMDSTASGRQAKTLPSIPEIVGENHNNSGVDQEGGTLGRRAGIEQGKSQPSERQDGSRGAGLKPRDNLLPNYGMGDFSNSANPQASDSRGPSPAMSSCSASTGSTVKEQQQMLPSSKAEQDSKKPAGLSNGLPERPRSAGGDFPEAHSTYMSVGDRQWLMRTNMSPTPLTEESLAWKASKFLEKVEREEEARRAAPCQTRHSFPPDSQDQQDLQRNGTAAGTAVRPSLACSVMPQQHPPDSLAARSSRQSEVAQARGVPDGVVGSSEPIWSKAGTPVTAAGDGGSAASQSLPKGPNAEAGGGDGGFGSVQSGVPGASASSAQDGGGSADLAALVATYRKQSQMLDGAGKSSLALPSASSKVALNVAESQISYAKMSSSGRAQPPDLRGSVRDSSLVCRTSEIGRGQQEARELGGQGAAPRAAGGLDKDSLDARVKSVLSEVSYLDNYKQVLAKSQAAGYGYLSRWRGSGGGAGAPGGGTLDYNQLHLDLTEIQSSLDAPHPGQQGPPTDTPTPQDSTSTTPDRNRRLLWDYGADLEYDETGRFVGNSGRLEEEELGRGRVAGRGGGGSGSRPRMQYNSEGEETRGSGSSKPDDQSSEGSHRSDDQAFDFLGGFDPHYGSHAEDGGRGMVDRVADILRRENPDAQALAILQEVQAQERQLFSNIILQSRMNRSYDGESSMDVSTLNSTLTGEPVKKQLFQSSSLSSPNASSLAPGVSPRPPTSREMAVSRFGWEAAPKGSSYAMSYAQSLISSQLLKAADRSFNHSLEFRTPVRRDIVCYPVFGQDRGPRHGEGEGEKEKGKEKEEGQGAGQGASLGAASGGAGEGQGQQQQQQEQGPQLLHEFPVRDRVTALPDKQTQEAWEGSPSTGRTAEESSGSQDHSDLTATSPSSYSASSPGDSDLSGGRLRGRLRPYKPAGVNYVYYTESDTGSVADSVTTVESTHTGSDDAVGPAFPPQVLGSRQQAVPASQGLYHRARAPGLTAEPALSTIEEKASEKSTQEDKERSSVDSGSQDGQPASKTPPADSGSAAGRAPEGRSTEASRSSQGGNGGQGSSLPGKEAPQTSAVERRQEGERLAERDPRERPGEEVGRQHVRREPLGSGRPDSESGLGSSGGRGGPDAHGSNGGQGRERSDNGDFGRDGGSSRPEAPDFGARVQRRQEGRDRVSPSAVQMREKSPAEEGARWVRGEEDREDGRPSRLAPPRPAWQDDQAPQELPPNLDRDPRLARPPLRDRMSPPSERRLSSSPVHEGRRSPGLSPPHTSPIPFRQPPDYQSLEPLEQLPIEEGEAGERQRGGMGGRGGRVSYQEARDARREEEEPMEVGGSVQGPLQHRSSQAADSGSSARVDDELSDSDPALALDREPLSQRVRLLQQALEQEFDPGLPPNLGALWAQFSNLNASAGADTSSTLDSSRLSQLADLLRHPSKHLVRNLAAEREAALQQERLAQEEVQAQAREQRRQEMRRLSSGPLSEEEVNGSYGEFARPPGPRDTEGKAALPRKQAAAPSRREPAPRHAGHGDSADTLYSIPEDTGLNSSSSLFHPEQQAVPDHVIDPSMRKLRDKIQHQKDRIDRERRKEIRRLQKLMRLEQLLRGKKRGLISDQALVQHLQALSSTSASSDSELVSDSTLAPTLSSHSLTEEDSSTTAKDSSAELAHRPLRTRAAMMEEAYTEVLHRLQRKTAATQTRSPASRGLCSKDEKLRMNEKLRIVGEMQRQRKQRDAARLASEHTQRKLAGTGAREERQRKRDAATMYPSPAQERRPRDKGRRVRVSTSAVQTTPGLQQRNSRSSPVVPALSLSRSRSRSQGRAASLSPSRPQSRSPSASLLRPSHSRSPPRCSHTLSRSPGAALNKGAHSSSQRTSAMFIPENPENCQPIKKKAKRKVAKPKIAGPGVAWYISLEEDRPWQTPMTEVQAQAPPPPPRPNDGRDPWRPEGLSLHLLQQLVAAQAQQSQSQTRAQERRRLGGDGSTCRQAMEEEEESTDYSNVENRARKPVSKMSLQEAFQAYKQDFISHSRQRDKRRRLAAEERRLQEQLRVEQEQLFQDCRRQEANVHAHPMADLHYQPKKRIFTMREMREMTEKKYKRLPEVVEKEKARKRKDVFLMNRIRARVFNKVPRRRRYRGKSCRGPEGATDCTSKSKMKLPR